MKGLLLIIGAYLTGVLVGLNVAQGAPPQDQLRSTAPHLNVGSGSIVKGPSNRLYILTNSHVCLAGDYNRGMKGSFPDGTTVYGPIVKQDISVDLCAIRLYVKRPALSIAPKFDKEETVYTRGYPMGVISESEGSIVGTEEWSYIFPTEAIGSCPGDPIGSRRAPEMCNVHFRSYITTLYSEPGSSGSPIVNAQGELVGVMSSALRNGDKRAGGTVRYSDLVKFMKGL